LSGNALDREGAACCRSRGSQSPTTRHAHPRRDLRTDGSNSRAPPRPFHPLPRLTSLTHLLSSLFP
ncbi:hypothetical protein K523DRAFT_421642, partial [Schizophyllum commune Tattone D]